MSEQVSINIDLFHANVDKLKSSLSDLTSGLNKNQTFTTTNISPFKDDLENLVKAIQLLEKYKAFLEEDIHTLKGTGDSIREKDEELARNNNNLTSELRPIKS